MERVWVACGVLSIFILGMLFYQCIEEEGDPWSGVPTGRTSEANPLQEGGFR